MDTEKRTEREQAVPNVMYSIHPRKKQYIVDRLDRDYCCTDSFVYDLFKNSAN